MGMNLDEKIKRVVAIVDEALVIQKANPVYVPTLYFEPGNLGFPSPRDVFRVLLENGAVKSHTRWWGYEMIGKNGKRTFEKTSSDEPQNDDDFEVYEIEVDERKLRQFSSAKRVATDEIEFRALAEELIYGKKVLAFRGTKDKLRLRLFKALWDDRCVVKNGKTIIKGISLPPSTVASRMELVDSNRDYERSTEVKEKLSRLIKNTKTTLRLKGMPITIRKQNGVQIVIEIK